MTDIELETMLLFLERPMMSTLTVAEHTNRHASETERRLLRLEHMGLIKIIIQPLLSNSNYGTWWSADDKRIRACIAERCML